MTADIKTSEIEVVYNIPQRSYDVIGPKIDEDMADLHTALGMIGFIYTGDSYLFGAIGRRRFVADGENSPMNSYFSVLRGNGEENGENRCERTDRCVLYVMRQPGNSEKKQLGNIAVYVEPIEPGSDITKEIATVGKALHEFVEGVKMKRIMQHPAEEQFGEEQPIVAEK